jgi:hypothetical protein
MVNSKTIAGQWDDYFVKVLLGSGVTNSVQIQETRRAFYAGAYALLMLLSRIASDDVTEESGVEYLEACRRECQAFYDLMGSAQV